MAVRFASASRTSVGSMSALDDWLANPTVKVVLASPEEHEVLKARIAELESEVLRLRSLYGQECDINMRLADLLRSHGIRWR